MTPFVPVTELQGLLKGSHQEVSAILEHAVATQPHAFGGKPARLLAAFSGHVIVLAESNNTVAKVGYSFDSEGNVHFTKHTPLNVPVVTEATLRSYLRSEAKAAASLFLGGQIARANEKIASIASLVDNESLLDDDSIVNSFLESRETARPWKTFVLQKQSVLKESVLKDVELAAPLKPKFAKLYDGATTQEELPSFKGLVHSDIAVAIKRLNKVEEQASQALQQIALVKAHSEQMASHPAGLALEETTNDLLNDVRTVRDFLLEASEQFSQVDLVAKVFDSIAAEVATFEVAGAFAANMALRLAEAIR